MSTKITSLNLNQYRSVLKLDEKPKLSPNDNWQALLLPVLQELGAHAPEEISLNEQLRLLHGILATIDPYALSPEITDRIESIALESNAEKKIINPLSLTNISTQFGSQYPAAEQTSIWVGDITQLKADAIVNAANSHLLGCRVPNHACIDNVIHSAAGPRLRDDCATIIEKQNAIEEVGVAKITRAYALPANYVIHTVGPQLYRGSQPTEIQRQQLISVYSSCLDVAAEVESIKSIAFCAISTGLFAYPKIEAAKVALTSVANWLETHPNSFDRVVFNLYSESDAAIYEGLLDEWK